MGPGDAAGFGWVAGGCGAGAFALPAVVAGAGAFALLGVVAGAALGPDEVPLQLVKMIVAKSNKIIGLLRFVLMFGAFVPGPSSLFHGSVRLLPW